MKIDEIFKKCTDLTMSKRYDYTSTDDNHENFKRSAEIASWFKNEQDKPYVVLIGTKLARLASLLDNKQPKNESIEDSFLDLINYCALWMERRTYKPTVEELDKILNCICWRSQPNNTIPDELCPVHKLINEPKSSSDPIS